MASYATRRVLLLAPLLLVVFSLTFTLFSFTPGDPCTKEKPNPQAYRNCRAKWHLDDPLPARYLAYLDSLVVHLDLGPSYYQRSRTVNDIVGQYFPFSLILGLCAMAFAV